MQDPGSGHNSESDEGSPYKDGRVFKIGTSKYEHIQCNDSWS